MPADLNREVQLADLLDQANERRARGQPATAVDLNTPSPLRDELDGLLSAALALDRAADDYREAAAAADTVNLTASPEHPTGKLPPSPPAETTALVNVGRYRLVRRVGAGGMGEVHEAFDPELGRRVALKLPFLGPGGDAVRQRFLREARAAAGVRHPNVCPVYDAGEDGGRPFVVMAFVDGESLADRLARWGFDDPREAAALAAKVAAGLAAVHAAGIIHRDLKPGNILIDETGNPLLTDFGLARPADGGEPITTEGSALGTPAYMSPEQADPSLGPTTHQSDLYSLGVTMFQMLTYRLPFAGTPAQQLARLASGAAVPPPSAARPDLDPRLDAVVLKATARNVADRYASAADLAADLNAYLASPVPAAATVTAPPPVVRPPKRRRGWAVPAAVAAAVLVGGVALWAAFGGGNGDDKKPGGDPTVQKDDDKGGENPAVPPPKTVKLDPDVLAPNVEKLPGVESWRFAFDNWVDAPQGVHFLGGNRLRFQFGTAGERDIDLAAGKVTEPRFAAVVPPASGLFAAVSPDRKHWVIQEGKGVLAYYTADDEKPRLRFRGIPQNSLASISPDGQTLAVINAASDDRRLMTYSLKTGDQLSATTVDLAGYDGFYQRPLWLDGGRAIGALVYGSQKLRFTIRTPDGKPVGDYDTTTMLHPWVGVTASADGSVAAAFGLATDKKLVVVAWRLQKGKQVPRFEEVLRFAAEIPQGNLETVRYLPYVSVSGDNKRLAFASGGAVRVWDLESKKLLLTVEVPAVGESPVTTGLSGDGKILLVRLKRSVRFLNVDDGTPRGALVVLQQGPKYDQWVAVSPDGHYKASSKEAEAKVRIKAIVQGTGSEDTAAEFAEKFRWKNDPSKVKLLGE